jgi:glycosyltransferase involved in cell wall biosynthesis
MDTAPRPPLVYLSPLPEMRNGIADYAAAILRRLTEHYECLCVVEDVNSINPDLAQIVTLLSYDDYAQIADRLSDVRHLAHIGNNQDHAQILDVLSHTPGLVVLHDLTMLYLLECWAQQTHGDARILIGLTRLLQGGTASRLTAFKFSGSGPLVSMYTEVNCLELMRDIATGVITHSHYGEVLLRTAGYERDILVLPHFAEIPDPAQKTSLRALWRGRFDIPDTAVVFASLGFVTPNKIVNVALEALAQLPKGAGDWRYIIAGENRDANVLATCKRLGLEDRVVFLDYLEADDFNALLAASDVLINLRFPTSGETSGTVCRALANGLPSILSDHGWYSELPDAVSWKVTPDRNILEELRATLLMALMDKETRQTKGRNAIAYAQKELDLDRIADGYRGMIEKVWEARADSRAAGCPPLSGAVFQNPSLAQETLPPRAVGDTLLAALTLEKVEVANRAVRICVAGNDFDLSGLTGPDADTDTDTDAPLQIFTAMAYDGIAGLVLNRIADTWDRLALGDFLTIALLQDAPAPVPSPAYLVPLQADFPIGLSAGAFLEQTLDESGFTVLRRYEVMITPDTWEGASERITIATARKSSLVRPELSFFRKIC